MDSFSGIENEDPTNRTGVVKEKVPISDRYRSTLTLSVTGVDLAIDGIFEPVGELGFFLLNDR